MGLFKKFTKSFSVPNANVSVTLSQIAFVQGQEVTGSLLVSSSEEFDITELRVELEDSEIVRADYQESVKIGGKDEVVKRTAEEHTILFSVKTSVSGPMHITQGFTGEYKFKIPIPVNASITYYGKKCKQ